MPPLPKVKRKREAQVTPRVLQWFRDNYAGSCAIEVKATDGERIPRSALHPHQKAALLDACSEGLVHKITDEARRQQPFDAFMLRHSGAFVVACFTKRRVCVVVDVREWEGCTPDTIGYASFSLTQSG